MIDDSTLDQKLLVLKQVSPSYTKKTNRSLGNIQYTNTNKHLYASKYEEFQLKVDNNW